jgi:hypothetical protein
MTQNDMAALMLLAAHLLALGVACLIFVWIMFLQRRAQRLERTSERTPRHIFLEPAFSQRPASWLAVRSATPEAVQAALGLSRSVPCSWSEGMAGGHEFFISPRVNGWVIVTGLGLPGIDDDVDACFLFLIALSRKLGHVQYFHAEKFSHHHAWARLDDGCVTRAFAWTGETVWNQGAKTLPETQLGLKCPGYGDNLMTIWDAETNFEKVATLSARWSLDPAEIRFARRADGIAGESARFY